MIHSIVYLRILVHGVNMSANREYKASFFSKLFSEPSRLRELYNALADTDYGEDTPFEINTLENVFFNDQYNDISFSIGDKFVVLIEHQSTPNANMPLRCLLYIARVYEKITDERAVYKEKLLKIPTPEFIVLYNGVKPFPAEKTIKLSDAFLAAGKPLDEFGGLELVVRVININPDCNKELLRKSETLNDYSMFVEHVRSNQSSGMDLRSAIGEAIKWGLDKGILTAFLAQHGSEVQNMLYTEFNIDIAKEVWQEEAREDAFAEGEAETKKKMARVLLALNVPVETIQKASGMTLEEIENLRE